MLGGNEPSVSVTGWSLGGGHSPYSPKIGLGADQIIELNMVLSDSSLVILNKDGMSRRYPDGTVSIRPIDWELVRLNSVNILIPLLC